MFRYLLFLLLPLGAFSQNGFIVTEHDTFPGYGPGLHQLFLQPEKVTELWLDENALDSLSAYDLGRLKNLHTVSVQFVLDPESNDSLRNAFVNRIAKGMQGLYGLSACKELHTVYFKMGEKIYLSTKEKAALSERFDKNGQDKNADKRTKLNLDRAWKSFGQPLQQHLPQAKLYIYEWNW